MMNTDFFQLLYTYLEERTFHNVYEQLKEDNEYQDAVKAEQALFEQYEELGLSEKQCQIIEQWTDAIHAKNAAYSMVIFRMGMQCCFSLMVQLGYLK